MRKYFYMLILCLIFRPNDSKAQFAESRIINSTGKDAESFQSLAFDGSWCWFSDPRAIYFEGKHKRTYAGWIDSYGDVTVGYYDHITKETATKVVADNFQRDDHDNPALSIDDRGKLSLFYTAHNTKTPLIRMEAEEGEEIDRWKNPQLLQLNDTVKYKFPDVYTYCNPYYLSKEKKYFLFWRGLDGKPFYSTSSDFGKTWALGKIVFTSEPTYTFRRPYMKVESNGKDKIFLAFTDGHPRNENENSIYFAYYKDGAYYGAAGKIISKVSNDPFPIKKADCVYDASVSKVKSWIWDIAFDKNENPALVYSKFPNDTTHIYCYARWDGKKWNSYNLINSGKWFPVTPPGKKEPEPNYSGGIVLDHEDPSIVYLSAKRDSVFEIEKWTTSDNGKSWSVEFITKNSSKDNVRPFAVRNAREGNPLQLLWMTNTNYVHYTNYQSSIKMSLPSPSAENYSDSLSIINLMRKVADWQIANPKKDNKLNWTYGAFYTGLIALYKTTKENRYLNEMLNIGENNDWKMMSDIFHADRFTITQTYIEIYELLKDPKMIGYSQWAMNAHLSRSSKADVRFENNPYKFEWWSWCDALYMAPPAFARMSHATGNNRYLDYASEHWWITSDYLYSKTDSLYYRDDTFFNTKTKNGKKTFWARGNGWVIAGLARMIDYMPKDYPSRNKFEQQFKEMAAKLLSLQRDHGLWTASLYDPEELPAGESSGSSFFTFALAWGINNGLLNRSEYEPALIKAWAALCKNVNECGRLGYVQQVAGSPYPFYENQYHVYATGAFLLAGKEMLKIFDVPKR